jgi:hypothetical protein
MKELNDNKIRETWDRFIIKHGLKIKENEIPLFTVTNKGQQYLTVEKTDECFILYKYLYYKFDPTGYGIGNYFKVSIPVDTKENFIIRRPGIFSRLLLSNSIKITSENFIELHSSLRELITESFNRFSDLTIRTSEYSFVEFGLPKRDNMLYLTIAGAVQVSGFCFALSFVSGDSLAARNPQLQV